jgi:hypothetical protein
MANQYVLDVEKPIQDLDRQIEELRRLGGERGLDVDASCCWRALPRCARGLAT